MPTILTADNRELTNLAKYSYLNANYTSGQSSVVVTSVADFLPNDFILIGEFGSEYAEIKQISRITAATKTLVLTYNTKYSHSESTKVTVLKYDQIRFFNTATTTFASTTPVKTPVLLGDETSQFDISNPAGTTFRYTWDSTGTDPDLDKYIKTGYSIVIAAQNFNAANNGTFTITGISTSYFDVTNAGGVVEANKTIGTGSIKITTDYLDIDTSSFNSSIVDTTYTTGYGWFTFYNSYSASSATNSSAIPYAGYAENSVKKILDTFFSLLNNKELKLISNEDAFSWLNEGYAIAKNELNLSNQEYTVSDEASITVVSGTKEYLLSTYCTGFSDLISVYNSTSNVQVSELDVRDISVYDYDAANTMRYYLRGLYIGFSPSPTSSITVKIRYQATTTALTSLYDTIDLPENNFYLIKDFMLYRAAPKLNRGDGSDYYVKFYEGIKRLKVTANKRGSDADSWGIDSSVTI